MLNFTRQIDDGGAYSTEKKPGFLSSLSSLSLTSSWSDTPKPPDSGRDNGNAPSVHGRDWIKGVVICSWVVGSVLTLNIILTVIGAGIAYSKNGDTSFSFAALYTGKCSTAKRWTTGMHFAINVLSTALLGASNYCLQCLASPSRAQIDNAHKKRISVRIGVPNIVDLLIRQRGKRQLLGWQLMVTSLPIHMIYNSAIFFALGPQEYAAVVAPAGPLGLNTSSDFDYCFVPNIGVDLATANATMSRSDLQVLDKEACVNTFAEDYVAGHSMVILVTNESMPENEPLAYKGPGNFWIGSKSGSPYSWLCDGNFDCTKDMAKEMMRNWTVRPAKFSIPQLFWTIQTDNGTLDEDEWDKYTIDSEINTPDVRRLNEILYTMPDEEEFQAALDDTSNWDDTSFPDRITIIGHKSSCPAMNRAAGPELEDRTYPIEHCLTTPSEPACQLVFSPAICLIVISCNLVKLICTLFAATDGRRDVFLTIGDAISSFLSRPDPTTKGSCLLSKSLVYSGSQGWRKTGRKRSWKRYQVLSAPAVGDHSEAPLRLELPTRKHWFQAVSIGRWVSTFTVIICIVGPAIYLLCLGIHDYNRGYGTKTIWDSGLGDPTSATVIDGIHRPEGTAGIFSMALLANVPQLLVSFAYFLLNNLLTIMLGAVEYSNYGRHRKPLRVSWPRGQQRSTYYLSLPYRYSFPLLGTSAVLHWLVSQSLYFVQIVTFDVTGAPRPSDEQIVAIAHSPVATVFAIIVGGLLPIASLLLGLRRFKSLMPLAAECSAAISAACHPPMPSDDDSANHALKPVQWGEVPGGVEALGLSPLTFSMRIMEDGGGNGSSQQLVSFSNSLNGTHQAHGLRSGAPPESELYHCSFSSGEVHAPSEGRLYI
ncbi:uncharacterized protein BDV14DRAFT_191554 [Aspergillus stella-maris]|uniref:uncharacterized protein n=1 Tax=Aspergillus stella-maris TaxID=1810926 RepID=UPI003CCD543C